MQESCQRWHAASECASAALWELGITVVVCYDWKHGLLCSLLPCRYYVYILLSPVIYAPW